MKAYINLYIPIPIYISGVNLKIQVYGYIEGSQVKIVVKPATKLLPEMFKEYLRDMKRFNFVYNRNIEANELVINDPKQLVALLNYFDKNYRITGEFEGTKLYSWEERGLFLSEAIDILKMRELERKSQKIIVYCSRIDIQFMEKMYGEKLPQWIRKFDRVDRDKVVEEILNESGIRFIKESAGDKKIYYVDQIPAKLEEWIYLKDKFIEKYSAL
ncbi:MAG: hypothetical protein APG12_00585 [Candidatus Methanofastidiosum methylothiophilum]|uniref:Uncharacterized protein n=1 Tax=Candidatus Methanofastidiosum methylothiophilum TaxID=1705564 RepID=A0A150J0L8_9EURY|nr:MAG: hypothetical protein APG10_00458 [Candidatus Methanofastidiosum methylthiophilus]KYC48352.1 MAG: hypothetical protein APG11_00365 [Candidatus Methanofastidiosum methylthiophilus]KYC50783.1 MAG: hypothetical protein APG12_00585 [Candidatus Methanofastidiosum methylthiophilus]